MKIFHSHFISEFNHISFFPLQVLHQLNVFSEDDVDAAAEALNDVSFRVHFLSALFLFQIFFFRFTDDGQNKDKVISAE